MKETTLQEIRGDSEASPPCGGHQPHPPGRRRGGVAAGVCLAAALAAPGSFAAGCGLGCGVPSKFAFLPGAPDVLCAVPAGPWDVVVTLDAGDTARLGAAFQPETLGTAPVLNVDHHVTNQFFGTCNYVDPQAAATSQILVDLADALGVPLTVEAATCSSRGLLPIHRVSAPAT